MPTFDSAIKTNNIAIADGLVPHVATLTDASSTAVNAALGNHFRLTFTSAVGNSRTMANPTNPTDGQRIIFELIQDTTGSRTVTWGTAYAWGTDVVVPTLTTTASKRDFIGFVYNSTAAKWYGVAVSRGY